MNITDMLKKTPVAKSWPKGTKGLPITMEPIKKPSGLPEMGFGRCRVCGKRTPVTAPPRYQLCQSCRLKGVKID